MAWLVHACTNRKVTLRGWKKIVWKEFESSLLTNKLSIMRVKRHIWTIRVGPGHRPGFNSWLSICMARSANLELTFRGATSPGCPGFRSSVPVRPRTRAAVRLDLSCALIYFLSYLVSSSKPNISISSSWFRPSHKRCFGLGHLIPIWTINITECSGAQEIDMFFLNNIFNPKGNCVLRKLKNSFAIFWAWHIHIHKVRAD